LGFGGWLVDPGLGRSGGWFRPAAEPFGVGVVGGGEGVLAFLVDGVGGAEVNRRRCVPADPGMPVNMIVFEEEAGEELPGVLEGFEMVGEVR